jgi:cyclophilin family peptidyl-prolyl cis-trans isomerase
MSAGRLELASAHAIQEEAMSRLRMQTSKGTMVIDMFDDDAPQTVANFVGLATGEREWTDPKSGQKVRGKPYFDGLKFHRVVSNFVVQGGDPKTAYPEMRAQWGTGGPGYKIKCETGGAKQVHHRGSLSMAHAGKDTGGSQFFICHSPQPHLDRKHTVFGQVVEGLDVIDKIREGDTIDKVTLEK